MEISKSSFKIAGIVSSILGIIGTVISLYAFVFQDNKPDLQYELVADANVFDINAEVSKLDILYDGNNLKNKSDNIRIVNLKIMNNGTGNILQTYYDDNDLPGFVVKNGELLEKPELLYASDDYLNKTLKISIDSTGRVLFSKVILESNSYFILKLLILYKSNALPDIMPIGKIAGIKSINFVKTIPAKKPSPFFASVFSGSIYIQIVRVFSYFIFMVIIIIAIAFTGSQLSSASDRRKRNKKIAQFKLATGSSSSKMDNAIFDRFLKEGEFKLKQMLQLVSDKDKLNETYKKLKDKKPRENIITNDSYVEDVIIRKGRYNLIIINEMIEDGIIIKENDVLNVNNPMKQTLATFVKYLQEQHDNHDYKEAIQLKELINIEKDS